MNKFIRKIVTLFMICSIAFSGIYSINNNTVNAAENTLVSFDIQIVGCQIRTKAAMNEGVAFRTVCKAPDIGSTIEVEGKKYIVRKLGTIYSKDINTTGDNSKNLLDKSYTILNPIPYTDNSKKNLDFSYIGDKYYNKVMYTRGYLATDEGIKQKSDGLTTYVRTMTNMDAYMVNSLWIRAFVVATDESGKDVIIYGQYAFLTSFAQIAHKIYTAGLSPSLEEHKYLYKYILHKLPKFNPYYINNEEEYGWGGVVTP